MTAKSAFNRDGTSPTRGYKYCNSSIGSRPTGGSDERAYDERREREALGCYREPRGGKRDSQPGIQDNVCASPEGVGLGGPDGSDCVCCTAATAFAAGRGTGACRKKAEANAFAPRNSEVRSSSKGKLNTSDHLAGHGSHIDSMGLGGGDPGQRLRIAGRNMD